jgi:hypothetical protein
MADVFFKLTAEEKDAVNAILKVVDAQKKAETGYKAIRTASEDTDKAAQAMGKSFEKVGKTIADGLIPGIGQITSAAGIASLAVSAINEQMQKGAKQAEAYSGEVLKLTQSLAQAGKISMFPEIEKQVAAIAAGSKSMTQSDVRGVASALGPDARKLDAKGLTESIQYAVQSSDAHLDPMAAGKMYAQLRGLNPDGSGADIQKASGQLLGLKSEPLDDQEILRFKRASAAGRPFDDALKMAMVGRKSGENGKTMDRISEAMNEEINPADLEDKIEMRPENKAKLDEIKRKQTDLAEQKLKINESGGTHGNKHKHQMREIELQEERLSLDAKRLEEDKITVENPKKERLSRLAGIPQNQREFAYLDDLSLLDPKLREKGGNVAAAMASLNANPPEDLLTKTRGDIAGMAPGDRETLDLVQQNAFQSKQQSQLAEGKNSDVSKEQLFFRAQAKQSSNAVGGGMLGNIVEFMSNIMPMASEAPTRDNEPKEVKIVDDDTKIDRVQPARNGGN